jgi:hypothetical protein
MFRKFSTEELLESLQPLQQGSLKVRPERGVDVDSLPREVIVKESNNDEGNSNNLSD